jgi:hypothetical protein
VNLQRLERLFLFYFMALLKAGIALGECAVDQANSVLMAGTSSAWECFDSKQNNVPDGIKLAPGGVVVIPVPGQPGQCYFIQANSSHPLPPGATGYWVPNPNITLPNMTQYPNPTGPQVGMNAGLAGNQKDWISFKNDTSLAGILDLSLPMPCSTNNCGTSNGLAFANLTALQATAPGGGLCNATSTASGITGSGDNTLTTPDPWTWKCTPALGPATTCNAYKGCAAGASLTWGGSCSATTSSVVPYGASAAVNDTSGLGSASFTCTSSGYNANPDNTPAATCSASASGCCHIICTGSFGYSNVSVLTTMTAADANSGTPKLCSAQNYQDFYGFSVSSCSGTYFDAANACPVQCASTTLTWGPGCSALVGADMTGIAQPLTDSAGHGNASFKCDTTTGAWNLQAGSTCTPPPLTNGACGPANGQTYATGPAATSAGLCNSGTPDISLAAAGPWSWTCLGSGGGTNSPACSAAAGGGDCAPQVVTWTQGAFSCSYYSPITITNGSPIVAMDAGGVQAYTCTNGAFVPSGPTTCL